MSKILFSFMLFFTAIVNADSHRPQDFLNEIAGSKNEGEQIVKHFCVNCHAKKPLIQLGAPRMLVVSDWLPRLKEGSKSLYNNSSEGLNAMPARGGCFECSDKQLVLAILAMLPDQLKNKYKKELLDHKKSR